MLVIGQSIQNNALALNGSFSSELRNWSLELVGLRHDAMFLGSNLVEC